MCPILPRAAAGGDPRRADFPIFSPLSPSGRGEQAATADVMLYFWLVPLLAWLFVLGAAVGSFLNVCIARLGRGKSLVWPGSRCGACFQEVRLRHNIPLVSYWWLRGRCRDCGATFSVRYFLVELFTALAFVGLYAAEIGANVHGLPGWERGGLAFLESGRFPPHAWELFAWHAALAGLLIAAAGGLLEFGRVPRGVTVVGVLLGLAGAWLFPWPWPTEAREALARVDRPLVGWVRLKADGGPMAPRRGPMPEEASWADWPLSPRPGFLPWPAWGPPPDELPAGSGRLGLVTGLVGGIVGAWLLRVAAWLAALGLGRPPLAATGGEMLLIAGTFLGWQPVLVALAVAAVLALAGRWARLPFGVWVTGGVVVSWLGWAWLGPLARPVLFHPLLMPLTVAASLALVFLAALLLRLLKAPAHAPFA